MATTLTFVHNAYMDSCLPSDDLVNCKAHAWSKVVTLGRYQQDFIWGAFL